ncbi:hypothetical protein GGR51DRAFT_558980 [Nemania sp. FL0031]|nr:hypothetical protein GGR51DRAFT_558980 [Nemania sp. FL0031]
MATIDSPMADSHDESNSIHFCDICYKPIARESAYKRHLAYCRRSVGRTKKRKRSCKQCHRAKAKCSFEPQCSRCLSKGFTCEYEKPGFPPTGSEISDDVQDTLMSELSGSSPSDATGSPCAAFTEITGFERVTDTDVSMLLPLAPPPRPVTKLREDPRQHASMLFLLEVARGVPYMLSRRETFPVFIHGQWHQPKIPTPLANCMRITQLFLARNASPQGRELFYSTMSEERARVTQQSSTKQELLIRLTLNNIFLLLTVFDQETPQATLVPYLEAQGNDIDNITSSAHKCFASDAYKPFDIDGIGNPNETWEEFIYAESRRRCALWWFIVSRVIDLHYGFRCPPVVCYRGLALPAPDALWTARTREDWEAARMALRERYQEPYHQHSLRTLGDLIDSRACASDPDQGGRVGSWMASCDKLGLMLVVASGMI